MKTNLFHKIISGKAFKKGLSFLLVSVLSLGMLSGFSATALAANHNTVAGSSFTGTKAAAQEAVYVALGDSVPAGYGLGDAKDCYVNRFSKLMTENGYLNKKYNYAVSGSTTKSLLSGFKNMQQTNPKKYEAINNADVITLNIGGNNVLGPFLKAINTVLVQQFKELGITSITEASDKQLWTIALSLYSMNLDDQMDDIKKGALSFALDYPKIIDWLKTNAPHAKIIVSTIYNPIPSLLSFYKTSETLLKEMNNVITNNSAKKGYYTVDVGQAFKEAQENGTQVLNLNIGQYKSPMSIDIHPNSTGHELIAKLHNEVFGTFSHIIRTQAGSPVTALLSLPGKADRKGLLSINVTKQSLQAAIDAAQSEAKQNSREKDGIAVIFNTSATAIKSVCITFDKAAVSLLKSKSVKSVAINTRVIRVGFDKEAIDLIKQKIKGDVIVKVDPVTALSRTELKYTGSRPVYKFTVMDTAGKPVTDLAKGRISLSLRYTKSAKEKASGLHIIFVSNKGQLKLLNDSCYDNGWVSCTNNIISAYGVGYIK